MSTLTAPLIASERSATIRLRCARSSYGAIRTCRDRVASIPRVDPAECDLSEQSKGPPLDVVHPIALDIEPVTLEAGEQRATSDRIGDRRASRRLTSSPRAQISEGEIDVMVRELDIHDRVPFGRLKLTLPPSTDTFEGANNDIHREVFLRSRGADR
jgi:hypothetical protein